MYYMSLLSRTDNVTKVREILETAPLKIDGELNTTDLLRLYKTLKTIHINVNGPKYNYKKHNRSMLDEFPFLIFHDSKNISFCKIEFHLFKSISLSNNYFDTASRPEGAPSIFSDKYQLLGFAEIITYSRPKLIERIENYYKYYIDQNNKKECKLLDLCFEICKFIEWVEV